MNSDVDVCPAFQEIHIHTSDGLTLRGARWLPHAEAPLGQILLIHGLGDHIGRHIHVAAALASRGLAGAMLDLRGHGRSGGRRGDVPDFRLFIRDVAAMSAVLDPRLPSGLLAFSFGGQIAVAHLLEMAETHWQCAALVAPWFRLRIQPSRFQQLTLRLLSRFAPGLRQKTGLRWEQLSMDPEHLDRIDPERLTHGWISARLYLGAIENGERVYEHASDLRLPVAVWHGGDDSVTCPVASEQFVSRLGSVKSRFILLPGIRHEPQNDICRSEFLADLAEWLVQCLTTSSHFGSGTQR